MSVRVPTPHSSADSDSPESDRDSLARELAILVDDFDGTITFDDDVIAAHSHDEAPQPTSGRALALVRARSIADVQAVVRFAYEHGIPVVPQGARTGLTGGANAKENCILLSVKSMDSILEISELNQTVTVEPGIVNQDLKDALRPHGLLYPPDPGSVGMSTIGGNIATNAGGMCCVKYGVTRDFVRELKVVLPDGTLTRVGHKTAKGVAGLELAQLFVGSEGTLGVIVEATLRLIPLPPTPLTAVATFPSERDAAETVAAYMGAGYRPSMFEMLDGLTISMLNELGDFGLDENVGAMLIMQSDSTTAKEDTEEFTTIADKHNAIDIAFSDNPADNDALVAARRMVHPANELYQRNHGGGQLIEDICIPRSSMADFFDGLAAIRKNTGVVIAAIAHAGDGNTHPALFFDADDQESCARAQDAFEQIIHLGLSLGGTITGEHGVGDLKSKWLPHELDEGAQNLHLAIKQAVDPDSIMNPGGMYHYLRR